MSKAGYFNLELNPKMAFSLKHTLNRPYRGSQRFEVRAPDASGTLIVHARTPDEADEHLVNALFELIFNRNRCGAAVTNPACLYCGGPTEGRGRNSSGTRVWRCLNPECRRSFVPLRVWRGGINHSQQSKKPAFVRLIFDQGKTVREARDILGISDGAADNWYRAAVAARKGPPAGKCPCGKPMRHRGSCKFRQNYGRTIREQLANAAAGGAS